MKFQFFFFLLFVGMLFTSCSKITYFHEYTTVNGVFVETSYFAEPVFTPNELVEKGILSYTIASSDNERDASSVLYQYNENKGYKELDIEIKRLEDELGKANLLYNNMQWQLLQALEQEMIRRAGNRSYSEKISCNGCREKRIEIFVTKDGISYNDVWYGESDTPQTVTKRTSLACFVDDYDVKPSYIVDQLFKDYFPGTLECDD